MSSFESTTVRCCVILIVIQGILLIADCHRLVSNSNNTELSETTHSDVCLPFAPIPNGYVQFKNIKEHITAFLQCNDGFALTGASIIPCIYGNWVVETDKDFPKCLKICSPPPFLINGSIEIKKQPTDFVSDLKRFADGTEAHYKCNEGYILDPASSAIRNCTDGIWSGDDAMCKSSDCSLPPQRIDNGFIYPEFYNLTQVFAGQKVSYKCIQGYEMAVSDTMTCSKEGQWAPNIPHCISVNGFSMEGRVVKCGSQPLINQRKHPHVRVVHFYPSGVELDCADGYQNYLRPCQTTTVECENGRWVGSYPHCRKTLECRAPPSIPYGYLVDQEQRKTEMLSFYPIGSVVEYECLAGYQLMDLETSMICEVNGCWKPNGFSRPRCVRTKKDSKKGRDFGDGRGGYFVELNNISAVLVSSATGAGVLGVLLLACLAIACKKRKTLARNAAIVASNASSDRSAPDLVNDHAILLQHPDRLALIACADGLQNDDQQNNSLPTYDEAIRSTVIQVSRLQVQRPYWPNLGTCRNSGRNRGSPVIDSGHHVPRHGSLVSSQTPSVRSGGESMGSTETVTISEGSTIVTLDTASSHSAASQNASCRGNCGSLASFDACSVQNTEGIPLLEESELEEIQGGSSVVENPHLVPDNASSKFSTHSTSTIPN